MDVSGLFKNTPTRWRYNELEVVKNELGDQLKVINTFSMQIEFTALQGAIHDLTNLKHEF